ncbi:hypothetical protein RVBP17_2830 [Pseudomonas phage sp. 30-3]|nr:hypothetical protein RVBP17_2830 [Pseudomonas phage sp. 30-3]
MIYSSHANIFRSVANSLILEIYKINISLEKMIDDGHGDILDRQVVCRKGTWFSKNYYIISSSAKELVSLSPAFIEISNITVSAYTSGALKNNPLSKMKGFDKYMHNVGDALTAINSSKLANKLFKSIEEQNIIVDKGREEYALSQSLIKENCHTNKGMQYKQLEEIINTYIRQLPEHLQHEARNRIRKSDKKLKSLISYAQEHNITFI